MKKIHSMIKQFDLSFRNLMLFLFTYLCVIKLLFVSFQASAQVEIHEFGATNIQYYIYSDGKTFEFTANNTMIVDSIIVQSWLAARVGTFYIEVSIKDSLLATWDQYVNHTNYLPYIHYKQVSFSMSEGDTIVYKIYGGSFYTAVGGLLGVNYIKLKGAQHVISASVSPEGTGSITGGGSYDNGAEVTLIASPEYGFHFVSWTENEVIVMDGEDQAGESYTFIALENRHLTANFAINEYILNYCAEDHGSIAGECIQTVEHGSDGSEVEAEPDEGYHFVTWSDGQDTSKRIDTNITDDLIVTATFSINIYTINASVNNSSWGIVSGSGDYEHGQTAILIATSHDENNYIFKNWTEEESVVHDEPEYVFTVTTNRILSANYQNVTNISIPEIIPTIKVFPLPAANFLNIESECLIRKIILLDLAGRIYYSEPSHDTQHVIHLSGISNGFYVLYVVSESGVSVKKIQIIK